jgi:F-type H+-transporting ATPase subunit delta
VSIETVARRYASALADVVIKTRETETVRSELKTWEQMIAGNAELENAFGNPSIAAAKKEAILEGLLQRANPSRTTSNFLRVLLQNGRLTDLAKVNERFEAVLEERGGVVSGEVVSAHELDDAARQELTANLQKLTGKKVKLEFAIDKDIIGGVVTRVGSTVYDSSVRTQLENLREQLVNG